MADRLKYLALAWTRDIIIQMFEEGSVIVCYGCPCDLEKGEPCALYDGKLFCLDCADGEGEII